MCKTQETCKRCVGFEREVQERHKIHVALIVARDAQDTREVQP